MTLVLKLDLDIVKMRCMCVPKMTPLPLTVQKLQLEQIHRQTDGQTQTDRDLTEIITYPHTRMVKSSVYWFSKVFSDQAFLTKTIIRTPLTSSNFTLICSGSTANFSPFTILYLNSAAKKVFKI